MSRLSDAWAALCGRLPVREVEKTVEVEKSVEVERPVPVGDGVVTVYLAKSRTYAAAVESYHLRMRSWRDREWHKSLRNTYPYGATVYVESKPEPAPEKPVPPDWSGRVYLTCAQAFAEIGADADLTPRKALIHDGKAYLFDKLTEHVMQPKPKRAKGARA